MSSEQERLSRLVSDFAEAMRAKLWKKQREGYGGWDDDTDLAVGEHLQDEFRSHVARYIAGDPKQLVDVANFAAMLWRLDEEKERRAAEQRRTARLAKEAGP